MDWTPTELARRHLIEQGVAAVGTYEADHALRAWARAAGLLVRVDRYSIWGNRRRMRDRTDPVERDAVCDWYATVYLPSRPDLLARVGELRGRLLVCHCHPARCHGHHLAALANAAPVPIMDTGWRSPPMAREGAVQR